MEPGHRDSPGHTEPHPGDSMAAEIEEREPGTLGDKPYYRPIEGLDE